MLVLLILFLPVDNVGEVDVADIVVVEVLDGEVGQHTAVSELVPSEQHLPAVVIVVDQVPAPLLSPVLCLESHRERTSHLDCTADRQVGSGLLIEKPQYLVVKINRCAGNFYLGQLVVLAESNLLHCLLEPLKVVFVV
jgi:hypothetical protein